VARHASRIWPDGRVFQRPARNPLVNVAGRECSGGPSGPPNGSVGCSADLQVRPS
jgi:hypothetical protein